MARILLADDNRALLVTMDAVLRAAGHQTVMVSNGREALEVLEEAPFDVLVTDIIMPEMEGLELITRLRGQCPTLRIIAISGGGAYYSPGDCLRLAGLLGACKVLEKPFSGAALVAMVASVMAEKPGA